MQPPGQPVHEQKDITRASNAMAEAGAFFKQTPEEEKSNGGQLNSVFTFSMWGWQPWPKLACTPSLFLPTWGALCQEVSLEKIWRGQGTWPTSRQFLEPRGTSGQARRCNDGGLWDLPSRKGSFPRRFATWPTNPRIPSHPSQPQGCAVTRLCGVIFFSHWASPKNLCYNEVVWGMDHIWCRNWYCSIRNTKRCPIDPLRTISLVGAATWILCLPFIRMMW